MAIRDIRFTGYTTVANCESEPIHVPGTIQPYGVLLAVNLHTLLVDFCSANTQEFLGYSEKDILGTKLEDIIGQEQCDDLVYHIREKSPEQIYVLNFQSLSFDISLHHQGDLMLLEIERSHKAVSLPNLFEQSRNFVSYLGKSDSLRGLCSHVAEEVRNVTGYDRVMIYRFDKEYNGEVYAESLNEGVESFLGLHYPHSDIPAQARALFERNLLRMIPDVFFEPVPMVTTKENATNESLDMSATGLRNVSPVHIEYLKNMGVGASLTVSLIHNEKLWGLIACHHNTPKLLPAPSRLSVKLHAHFLTSQISSRESAREYKSTLHINELVAPVIKKINKSTLDQYQTDKQLFECIHADGIAIITANNQIDLGGRTPTKEQIVDLVGWLDQKTESDYYATSGLSREYSPASDYKETASGVLFHSLNKGSKQGVLWFRSEKKRTLRWAGAPDKDQQDAGAMLRPRKSFAVWEQLIANTSADWEGAEIQGAIRLATNIQNNIFLSHITREEKKYRLQTYKLEKLNEELVDFNYICSHDLQEPIRKIQVFSTMLLSEKKPVPGFEKEIILKKINLSAQRAVALITDLLDLASVFNYSDVFDRVNLDECLARVETDLELVIAEKNATFTRGILGNVVGIQTQIEQLLYNLIGNALKFSNGPNPEINITLAHPTTEEITRDTPLDPQVEYVCLKISDNGIGFDQEFANKIFSVFYRLNDKETYAGRGIGLAICKKIVENHEGFIMAKSEKDHGAAFYIYLKK